MYTDPSGEFFWMPVIIGGLVGGASGGIMAHNAGAQGFWEWAGYIGGGAFFGGLSGGAAAGVSALGGGASLAGAAAGAIGGAGFSGMAGNDILQGAKYGAIAGLVGGIVGSGIGGGWGALVGGASSNLTSQLLNNNGYLSNINWTSVGISGLTSLGIYHGISYYNWKWGGGRDFGDVKLTYKAYNKLNALFTRSRFIRRELVGAVSKDGDFTRIYTTGRTETTANFNPDAVPSNTKYLVHTHFQANGWPIDNSLVYGAKPYEPSNPIDYDALKILGLDEGMILTNKSILNYNVNVDIPFHNNWTYPSIRYNPMFWWFNMGINY